MLAYGERPRREEAETIQEPRWAVLQADNIDPDASPGPEIKVRQPRAPPMADQIADVREIIYPLRLGCTENQEEHLR